MAGPYRVGMDFAGGHDARTRPAGNSLDLAGPTPAVVPADPEFVNAGNPATPSAAPSASSGGAAFRFELVDMEPDNVGPDADYGF